MAKDNDTLFQAAGPSGAEPLAERMRPRTLDEYIGQDHIVGPGRLLRRAIQADRLSSVIFAGPPGTGKTTLARVIANSTSSRFQALNAVLSGVADIREAIKEASLQRDLYQRRTILFVDEVHRWNKAQQDALLPWVENGTIRLIGATTENPWFEVNPALVSRSRVFMLKPLEAADLRAIARQALTDPARGYGKYRVELSDDALDHLVHTCNGDGRSLLNALELAVETTPGRFPPEDPSTLIYIDRDVAAESIQKKAVLYDKDGDWHYDVVSAFIKSVRGSDPDAALYWLTRMVSGGEDPGFIFRRLLISASEDVGLADPQALGVVAAAAQAFDRVGMPEGQYFLAQATLYLATCPKSNSTLAYFDALRHHEEARKASSVPSHLKDASRDGEALGHGQGYQYPHAWRDHWVAQTYLPGDLRDLVFYQPSDCGHEKRIADEVRQRKWAQLELGASAPEHQSASPADRVMEQFMARLDAPRDQVRQVLEALLDLAGLERHHRVACLGGKGLFAIPRIMARIPNGLLMIHATPADREKLEGWMGRMLPPDRDSWTVVDRGMANEETWPERGIVWSPADLLAWLDTTGTPPAQVLAPGSRWVVAVPSLLVRSRPSSLLGASPLRDAVQAAEDTWLGPETDPSPEGSIPPLGQVNPELDGLWDRLGARPEAHALQVATLPLRLDPARTRRWTDPSLVYWQSVLQGLSPEHQEAFTVHMRGLHGQEVPWKEAWHLYRLAPSE